MNDKVHHHTFYGHRCSRPRHLQQHPAATAKPVLAAGFNQGTLRNWQLAAWQAPAGSVHQQFWSPACITYITLHALLHLAHARTAQHAACFSNTDSAGNHPRITPATQMQVRARCRPKQTYANSASPYVSPSLSKVEKQKLLSRGPAHTYSRNVP